MKLLWIIVLVASQSSAEIFSIEPEDTLVPLDSTSNIEFRCKANVANPVYSWRKDNTPLDTAGQSRYQTNGGTLTISSPQADDEGKYQCVVQSEDGIVVSNYGNLIFEYVKDFPNIVQAAFTTSQGDGIALECPQITYEPQWSVTFYWEKVELEFITSRNSNKTHFVSQKDGKLYFANPVQGDSGNFSCRVKSNWELNGQKEERQSSLVQLKVAAAVSDMPARFMLKPDPVTTAKRGGIAVIQCFAAGRPTPTISWTKVNGELPPDHAISPSGQLVLQDVTDDMAGTYECTAANSLATVKSQGQLELQYEPQWTKQISSEVVEQLTPAKFSCSALGNPQATYFWLKDGVRLSNTENVVITDTQDGSELTVVAVNTTDVGMYQCVGQNNLGYIFSSAHLSIATDPPMFNQQMDDIEKAALHSDVIINCDVIAAPAPTFDWSKDGQVIDLTSEKFSLVDGGNLKISHVNSSDAGDYTCTASNSLGEVSGFTSLKVYSPTTVTTHTVGDVDLEAGDAIMLECSESHDMQLDIKWSWTQNNQTINKWNQHYAQTGGSLELLDVGSDQIGTYECCVSSDVGTDCAQILVDVLAPPDPPSNVMIQSSSSTTQNIAWSEPKNNGAPVTSYEAEAWNEYDMTWFSACISNKTSCEVFNLLPHNKYWYRVYAFNKMGKGKVSEESSPSYTLMGAPVAAPTGISGGGGTPGQLVVTWEPFPKKFYGSPTVTYTISMRKEDPGVPVHLPIDLNGSPAPPSDKPWSDQVEVGSEATQTIFQVNSSEIFKPYEVRVRADNAYGNGPFSDQVVVYTAELPPDQSPTGFKRQSAKAYSAEITWNYLSNTNGYTQGYQVSICSMIDYNPCENPKQWRNFTTADETPYIKLEGLQANYNYKLKAAGFNSAGLGPWSDFSFLFVTTGPPPDNAPINVKLKVLGLDLTAQWDPVQPSTFESAIQGYVVQYWLVNQTSADARDHYTEPPSVEFKLPHYNDYMLWVRAFNEGGNGRPSTTYHITTKKGVSGQQGDNASALKCSSLLMLLCVWTAINSWLN